MYNQSLLEKIFSTLHQPQHTTVDTTKWWQKIWDAFRVYNFFLVFEIGITILTAILLSLIKYNPENSVSNLAVSTNFWLFFFLAAVYAPITEEMTFRLILKPTIWNLSIGLSFLINLLVSMLDSAKIIPFYDWLEKLYKIVSWNIVSPFWVNLFHLLFILTINILFLILLIAGFYVFLKAQPRFLAKIDSFYKQHFGWIFYVISLAFGLMHITNYTNLGSFWIVGVFLVLPQIIAGFELGYIRIRMGIFYSMFIHAINNLIPVVFIALTGLISQKDTAETVQYTQPDLIIIIFLMLAFIFLLMVNLGINVFNIVELVVSLKKKQRTSKPENTLLNNDKLII